MMGNLFSRGQPIGDIRKLGYKEMKYWNEWHEVMAKRERQTARELENAGRK